jgi:hypothetical protein
MLSLVGKQSISLRNKLFALYQTRLQRLRKTLSFEGYGLQPVHKRLKIGAALAAEGRISIRLPTFSAASSVVPFGGIPLL